MLCVTTSTGVDIAVRELGAGPSVVLVHGWSLSGEVWDRQIRILAESGNHVVAMDMRGHGGSDAPLEGYDIDTLADDLVSVVEQRCEGLAALVGWSLGGLVALRATCTRPELVSSLVLVASQGVAAARHDGFPFGVPPEPSLATMLGAEHHDRIALRRRAVGDPFKGGRPDDATLDWLLRISLQTPSWSARSAMTTLMCTDQTDLLENLEVPITQIVGIADPALSLRGARWLHETASTTLVELDCGHYPMLECPDDFDAALVRAVTPEQFAG